MKINRPRLEEIGLAVFVIVLALGSVIYGVIQTNAQKDLVACHRNIIIETNNALRQRDEVTIEQATSSKEADRARREVIFVLVNRTLREVSPVGQEELDRLLTEYNRAVDKRTVDLDMTIDRARSAPVPTYSCLDDQASR